MPVLETALEAVGVLSLVGLTLTTVTFAVLLRKGNNLGPWG